VTYHEINGMPVYLGDCRDVMRELHSDSVDSIVTDPPYELGFMGKRWDATGVAYDPLVWKEAFRILKPGGHLLAFGGTRTWHRLAVAIEDAGFEVRDSVAWMYGSGFPKSLDVSKAIDKNNGETGRKFKFTRWMCTTGVTAREINEATGTQMGNHYLTNPTQPAIPTPELWQIIRPLCGDVPAWVDELVQRIAAEREVIGKYETDMGGLGGERLGQSGGNITAPATPAAEQWQGWGTALKPAHEPIVVARKPLIGTVAENLLTHGTGALNIDGCRIAGEVPSRAQPIFGIAEGVTNFGSGTGRNGAMSQATGRWPANVILDESQAAELDKQSGVTTTPTSVTRGASGQHGTYAPIGRQEDVFCYGDTGGASRFFYVAKASKKERPNVNGVAHPTVKPMALMRYLVRLVTPPGGTVLEPFAGSGTTIEACVIEGFHCIAIEREADYLPLIEARLNRPIQGAM
jgi:hypothetical protein